MTSNSPRNVSIRDLLRYKFPLTALVSIGHRISGVLVFLSLPGLLWFLCASVRDPDGFMAVKRCLATFSGGLMAFIFLAAFFYHALFGIKHLLMDCGFFEEKKSGFWASLVCLIIFGFALIGLGVYVW